MRVLVLALLAVLLLVVGHCCTGAVRSPGLLVHPHFQVLSCKAAFLPIVSYCLQLQPVLLQEITPSQWLGCAFAIELLEVPFRLSLQPV